VLVAALLIAGTTAAQPPPEPPPPDAPPAPDAPPPLTISYADGRVDVVRAGGVEAVQVPDVLAEDERLVTGEGRAELVFDDGSLAHIDRESDVRVDLGVRLRLVRGRMIVHTADGDETLLVSTPAGPVRLDPRGEYDLSADDLRGDTVVAVERGRAALVVADSETPIEAGTAVRIDPRDRRLRWERGVFADAFSDWSRRRAAPTTVYGSAPAGLPPAARPWVGDLSRYGQWGTLDPYGPVWYPLAGPDWRPYLYGSWRYTRYGWTWIDRDPWAWPLHHYGRWGRHHARGWYWIPHRRWAPAWVGWVVAADHIGWSPLGWNARPVVDFFTGIRVGPVHLWASSWSILPRHHFGSRGRFVHHHLRDPRHLPGPVLGGFVSQLIGPRGPAGRDDRFARRTGPARQTGYRTGSWDRSDRASRGGRGTDSWRRPDDGARRGETRPRAFDGNATDANAAAAGREAVPRRPMDAARPRVEDAPRDVDRSGNRDWQAPADDGGGRRRRDAGDVRPVGPPVAPRVQPRGDDRPRDAGQGGSRGWGVQRSGGGGARAGGGGSARGGGAVGTSGAARAPRGGAAGMRAGGGGGERGSGSVQGGRRSPSAAGGRGSGGAGAGAARGGGARRRPG
jgi:hypothetical protein